jgi:hypothetical protein
MSSVSVDWLVGLVCVFAATCLIIIDVSYKAGFEAGGKAANGVCKITCSNESKESKEIRSIIEKKTLEALKK